MIVQLVKEIVAFLNAHPVLYCVVVPVAWGIIAFILKEIVASGSASDYPSDSEEGRAMNMASGCLLLPIILGFFGITYAQHKLNNMIPGIGDGLELEERDPIYWGKK